MAVRQSAQTTRSIIYSIAWGSMLRPLMLFESATVCSNQETRIVAAGTGEFRTLANRCFPRHIEALRVLADSGRMLTNRPEILENGAARRAAGDRRRNHRKPR
jgi:hypothetical protein